MNITVMEELRMFNQVYREMDAFYHMLAVKSGLSDSALWILYSICEDGDGCSQKKLCEKLSTSKQTIHSAIHKLEQDGILYLEEGTGRDKNICLTESGKQLMEQVILPIIAVENEAFAMMGETEAKELLRLSERYGRLIREVYEAGNEHTDFRTL